VLVVTNDFPPRLGGIQSFVHRALDGLPPEEITVYASTYPGAEEFDAAQPYRVIRHRTGLLLPTPASARRIAGVLREVGAEAVWFGAAAPLGLLAPTLRRAGARRLVATTHGHEAGWAQLPVARSLLRRIADGVDVLTYLGDYTRRRLAGAVGERCRLERLAPGVDVQVFRPDVDDAGLRVRHGLGAAPVVACVSRLVPRKGQDTLIRAWPAVRAVHADARLLIVGRGRYEPVLRRLAERESVAASVVFTGGVSAEDLPAYVRAGDVFAMPCRTRRGGLDVEGLGIVYLEASACGRAVVAGRSGGAPDAVLAGRTGVVVDGRDVATVAGEVIALLANRERADELGRAGRAWVEQEWQWAGVSARLDALLQG
jgi:phosphatidylinositol alpha-1,6-mannosyltransferase